MEGMAPRQGGFAPISHKYTLQILCILAVLRLGKIWSKLSGVSGGISCI